MATEQKDILQGEADLINDKVELIYTVYVKNKETSYTNIAEFVKAYKFLLSHQLNEQGMSEQFDIKVNVDMSHRAITLK